MAFGQTVFKPCRVLPESSLIVTKLLEFYLKKPIFTDPFGRYTGLVKKGDDKPVQDADDL